MAKKTTKKESAVNKIQTKETENLDYSKLSGPFFQPGFFRNYWKEILILAVLSFGLYQASIRYEYVLDDLIVITENKFTKKGFAGIKDILTTESFTGYFGEQKNLVMGNRYRPLSIVTFAIEYSIVGDLNPGLSHFINIVLYFITAVLLLYVLNMMFRNYNAKYWWLSIPFIASVLFVAHPIHVEAVANIKGRDEIMSMLFSTAALIAALRYSDGRKWPWMLSSSVLYFLALLSKENAITFLAVIPLTIYFFSRDGLSRSWTLMGVLLLTTIAYLTLRFNTAGVPDFKNEITDLFNNPFYGMTGFEKLGTKMYTLGKYILLLIFPHPLTHDYYPYAIPKVTLMNVWAFTALLVHIGLVYIGFKYWKQKSVISYSIWFYLITLSIVSNIVINVGTFMNERFIFMSSAGYCILLAYLISVKIPDVKNIKSAWLSLAIFAVLTLGYGFKTVTRVPDWKNTMSLNKSGVEVSPNSARANSFMSTALFEEYKVTEDFDRRKYLLEEARKYAARAIEIVPEYANANLMMVGVISETFKMDYKIDRYIQDMRPLILRRPDLSFIFEFSEWLNQRNADRDKLYVFYQDVGYELLKMNTTKRLYAQKYLEYAYNINPRNKKLAESLATAYELNNNFEQARTVRAAAQGLPE